MKRLWFATLSGVASVALAIATASAEEPAGIPAPPTKYIVERPTERLVGTRSATVAAPPAVRDETKGKIERPTEALVGGKTAPVSAVNPKVLPGKVQWQPSFDAACRAAKKSGKPILLFQLLGQLDEQFT